MKKVISLLLIVVLIVSLSTSAGAIRQHNDSSKLARMISVLKTEIEYYNQLIEQGVFPEEEQNLYDQLVNTLLDLSLCYVYENGVSQFGDIDTLLAKKDSSGINTALRGGRYIDDNSKTISNLKMGFLFVGFPGVGETKEETQARKLQGNLDTSHRIFEALSFIK